MDWINIRQMMHFDIYPINNTCNVSQSCHSSTCIKIITFV